VVLGERFMSDDTEVATADWWLRLVDVTHYVATLIRSQRVSSNAVDTALDAVRAMKTFTSNSKHGLCCVGMLSRVSCRFALLRRNGCHCSDDSGDGVVTTSRLH
jgi:hypothetical protein